ncbi:MAG: hypothetical protein ACRDD7_09275 [Peptostreptococcaceae bacterium]
MHKEFSVKVSCPHISTSYNELAKCVINGFSDKVNGSLKISNMDIKLCEFLHRFKMATLEQINIYFEIIGFNKNWTNRLEKLNKSYNLINEITLYNEDEEVVCYTLDIGGMYLLHNFSNEDINPRVDDLTSQRKTYESMFKVHPHSIIKSLICTQIYIIELAKAEILNVENRFRIRECLKKCDLEDAKSLHLNLKIDMMLNIKQLNSVSYFIKVITDDNIEKICSYIEKFKQFISKKEFIDKYCSLDIDEVKLYFVFSNDMYFRTIKELLNDMNIDIRGILFTNKELVIKEGIDVDEYIAI